MKEECDECNEAMSVVCYFRKPTVPQTVLCSFTVHSYEETANACRGIQAEIKSDFGEVVTDSIH